MPSASSARSLPSRHTATARWRRWLVGLMVAVGLASQTAAQSILRDSETEQLFADMSAPLVKAAGLKPANVKVVLVNDDSINAFVAGGQIVYIHSGLLTRADNANQVQGVIAHELGHVVGGHVLRGAEGEKKATIITLLSLLAGVAAIAAGAGEAGQGIMMLGQQAALGAYLGFTQTQEASADQAGAAYLGAAGISGRGSIDFFKKLRNQEYRLAIPQDYSYGRTHPLTGERIAALEAVYRAQPGWARTPDPQLEARFQRVKGKLIGYLDPQLAVQRYPERDQSIAARYARAYAYHRGAYPQKAQAEADALLATAPNDPFFNELKGQILLESGKPRDALPALRLAVARAPDQPMIAVMLGHALVATEDRALAAEARGVLRAAVSRDRENPLAWLQLGILAEREGDTTGAALAGAEGAYLEGQWRRALVSARTALAALPKGSPDAVRARDIELVASAEIERERKRKAKPVSKDKREPV